jgi:hypothetical protein
MYGLIRRVGQYYADKLGLHQGLPHAKVTAPFMLRIDLWRLSSATNDLGMNSVPASYLSAKLSTYYG